MLVLTQPSYLANFSQVNHHHRRSQSCNEKSVEQDDEDNNISTQRPIKKKRRQDQDEQDDEDNNISTQQPIKKSRISIIPRLGSQTNQNKSKNIPQNTKLDLGSEKRPLTDDETDSDLPRCQVSRKKVCLPTSDRVLRKKK